MVDEDDCWCRPEQVLLDPGLFYPVVPRGASLVEIHDLLIRMPARTRMTAVANGDPAVLDGLRLTELPGGPPKVRAQPLGP